MPSTAPESKPTEKQQPAAQHVKDAHRLLTGLREKLDRHPELEEAIQKLEEALRILGMKTGAML